MLMENYQIIRQIGHGNFGDVWLVKCSKTRKKHVLKRIDLQKIPKRDQRTAFSEAKLLSTLKHPNLVRYLDSFHNSAGSLFIVMSFCEFGNLYDCIKCQNGLYFEEKLIVQWFVQICLALKYLHDRNILHSNLKTKNIFLVKNEVIKVGNIGVSKILSFTQEMIPSLIETPHYMSPENISGAPSSQKSDIWALGCCVYEVCALKHPFAAQDSRSLLQKIKKKLPPLPEIYSKELYDAIISMLNILPEKRPCVTSLLLNDYIRKYILLILQHTPKSPYNQYSENSSSLSSGRSKSSSDLTPRLHNQVNGYVEKSRSTNMLANTNFRSAKLSGPSQKLQTKNSKESLILVPDVNGNADGNDNSQDRLTASYQNSLLSWSDSYKDTDSWDGSSKNSAKSENELRTRCSPAFTSFETRMKARQQKKKGEISLKILNHLTCTLQTARSDKFVESYPSPLKTPKYAHSKRQSPVSDSKKITNILSDNMKQEQTRICVLPPIN